MKLKLQCDTCGKIGTTDEISTDYDNCDLCVECERTKKLAELKQQHAEKIAWLESTHLKALRKLEEEIEAIELVD